MTRHGMRCAAHSSFALAVLLLSATQLLAQSSDKNGKPARPSVGEEARDFELSGIDGKKVKISSLTSKGPLVLVVLRGFPGYQCPICNKQVSGLLGSAQNFKDAKANVVLVYPGPAGDLKKHAEEFVRGKTLPENFYLVLDPDYEFTKAYDLRWDAPAETAYPSTFVIDANRKVQFAKVSKSHGDRASLDDVLKALGKN